MKRFQIVQRDDVTGKWSFVAHGARYGQSEANDHAAMCKLKGRAFKHLLCGKDES